GTRIPATRPVRMTSDFMSEATAAGCSGSVNPVTGACRFLHAIDDPSPPAALRGPAPFRHARRPPTPAARGPDSGPADPARGALRPPAPGHAEPLSCALAVDRIPAALREGGC